MDGILRWALPCLMSVSLLACTTSATDEGSGAPSAPVGAPEGVTLVLVATHASHGCCRVFTINPGRADLTVACGLVALDPAGRLIYLGGRPCQTARPPTEQRLRRAAGSSRTRRAPTPHRSCGRLVHGPMPTRSLARRRTDLMTRPVDEVKGWAQALREG